MPIRYIRWAGFGGKKTSTEIIIELPRALQEKDNPGQLDLRVRSSGSNCFNRRRAYPLSDRGLSAS